MFIKKSVTTEVFAIDWFDLVEYCPGLVGLSPEDADDYALAHRHDDVITRAVVDWAADQVWPEPEYRWTNFVAGANWELGALPGEVLVQCVLCRAD